MTKLSNYGSFAEGATIRGLPVGLVQPGAIYWVSDSTAILKGMKGGSDTNRGTFNAPFATIARALAKCVAGRGDIIIVKAGHTETISSATALLFNVKGVQIIGLGHGSSRPTLTFSTANTATIAVSADDMSIENFNFKANFLSIAAAFTVAAAKNFAVRNCLFTDTSSILNFLNIVKSTGAANTVDGLTLENNKWTGLGTTSVNSFLLSANTIDRLTLSGNTVILARTATAAVLATITAGILTNAQIIDNVGISQQTADTGGGLVNVGGTTSSGVFARNYLGNLSTTDVICTTTVGFSFFNNYKTGVITASGYLLPAADA